MHKDLSERGLVKVNHTQLHCGLAEITLGLLQSGLFHPWYGNQNTCSGYSVLGSKRVISLLIIIIIMKICKAPTLRLKVLNKHTHIMYIEMENVIKKQTNKKTIVTRVQA